ncbi:MAG: galactose oxidase [Chloroflexi bacterium]|nr:galactose oxidase [Chloroflexota bacterium]
MPTPSGDLPSVALSAAELEGLMHQGVRTAVADLQRQIGGDPGQIRIVRAQEVTWRDTSLGCPEPGQGYLQVLTPGAWLILSFQGREYDYRIAGPQAFLCTRPEKTGPLEGRALDGFWSRLASAPTARSEVAVAELNGRIHVLGGLGPGATANEEYDPPTDTWRGRAPVPQRVDHAAAVATEGKLYFIGGFDGSFRPISSVWAYASQTDTWTRKADLPTPRGALSAAVVDGKIYAIGGRGPQGDVGTNEEYDPATDTWRSRSPMLTPRDHLAVVEVRGKVYAIGGRLGTFAQNLDDNEVYDPATDTWTRLDPLPTPRSGIAAAAVDGQIHVFGGEAVEGTFNANERYDPATNAWKTMPPMPTARHGLGAVALGDRIYTLAGGPTPGGSQSPLNEVFIVLKHPD